MSEQKEIGSKPPTVSAEFSNFTLEVSNEPLCTIEQISSAFKILRQKYPQLVADLPDDHPWKNDKIAHATDVRRKGGRIFENLGRQLSKENFALLIFIAGSHDIGRAIQAKKQLGIPVEEEFKEDAHHGKYSVEILNKWGVFSLFPPETAEIISFAVEHHNDITTPNLPENPTEKDRMEIFLTAILRDMDKLAWLLEKPQNYFFDEESKRQQIKVNQLSGEEGKIEPGNLLNSFVNHQPIKDSDCQSYESFALRTLSWIFDINLKATLEKVVRPRLIQNYYFKYFQQQLPPEESEKIVEATKKFFESKGLPLEA